MPIKKTMALRQLEAKERQGRAAAVKPAPKKAMAKWPTRKESLAAEAALLPWRLEVLGEMVKLLAAGRDVSEERRGQLRKMAMGRLEASEKKNPLEWAHFRGKIAPEDVAELVIRPESRESARMRMIFFIPDFAPAPPPSPPWRRQR